MDIELRSNAVVERRKLADYLLSLRHPDGRHKARFFQSLGYPTNDVEVLRLALLEHCLQAPLVDVHPSPHGTKYVLEGPLGGGSQSIRTVWIQDERALHVRLVTAYPV